MLSPVDIKRNCDTETMILMLCEVLSIRLVECLDCSQLLDSLFEMISWQKPLAQSFKTMSKAESICQLNLALQKFARLILMMHNEGMFRSVQVSASWIGYKKITATAQKYSHAKEHFMWNLHLCNRPPQKKMKPGYCEVS